MTYNDIENAMVARLFNGCLCDYVGNVTVI